MGFHYNYLDNTDGVKTKNIAANCPFSGGRRRVHVPSAPYYSKEQLKHMFMCHDANGDGRLSLGELRNAFTSLGSWAPSWRDFRALRQADKNRDGYVSNDELDYVVKYAAKRGYTID